MDYNICPAELLGYLYVTHSNMAIMDVGSLSYDVIDKIGLVLSNHTPIIFYQLQYKSTMNHEEYERQISIINRCGFEVVTLVSPKQFIKSACRPTLLIGVKPNTFINNINRLKLHGLDLRDFYIDFMIPTNRDFLKHVDNTIGYRRFFSAMIDDLAAHQEYMGQL